jgi:hypothetical protein
MLNIAPLPAGLLTGLSESRSAEHQKFRIVVEKSFSTVANQSEELSHRMVRRMSPKIGTELPIRDVPVSVAIGGTADLNHSL